MAERLPPQNVDAERSVLGALLIDKDAIVKIAEFLSPKHFYNNNHGLIYQAAISLFEKGRPIDMVTVPAELKKGRALERIGGISYLAELASSIPTSAHIESYGYMIKDSWTKRELISVSTETAESGFDESTDVHDLLDKAEQSLFSIAQEGMRTDFVPIKKTLEESFDRIEELHKTAGKGLRGVPTGFTNLDSKLSGLQNSNLIILAARPSVGKSSLATNIAQFAASHHKIPVGLFSLEMSREQLIDRMLSAQADVDSWKITTGNLEDEDFQKLGQAMGELAEAPIYIDDTPGASVMEIRAKARRLKMDKNVGLIIVDYLQLVRGRGLDNRVQEVSEISMALKNIARELKIPVVACSQLSRAVETRGSPKPQLSDLRESGSIEQDADLVMFLYRPDEEDRSNVMLSIAKHRNGPTAEIGLFFRGDRVRFFEAENRQESNE
ncbi:replicative DNA helicase [candidate division WWE3 bacterium CG08_land_8_20_14_0_20_41_15]|uniref:Replicative DNA helicase n=1 Tax=candidate division WWE3 bacterium CG08_land_8_20_14_0_20_41_15 TaxID=1975086 RepID=A0A2H0X9G4_UNCKA|nr:MAG: replicative DNA helicase [candidate division WWE3 bacterium CG08_land_8_20_14_0_20_41_15]